MAAHNPQIVAPWSRRKLIAALTGVAVMVLALVVGLVLAVHSALTSPLPDAAAATAVVLPLDREERRDVLAAEPMLQVSRSDSQGGTPAAVPGPVLEVPASTVIGAGKVASGFPHTPEGAIGQLAAIEVTVLSEMNVARVVEVWDAWAADGAGPVEQWRLMGHVRSFLAAMKMGDVLGQGARVTVTPAAAQTKASDGPDWTIACVLVDVRAVYRSEARMAYGYCERMVWDGQRWLIGPGTPPALAPSTWPGTDLAVEAGWRTWTRAAR